MNEVTYRLYNYIMELKPSAYNIVVPPDESGRGIVYNTRTGALAVADEVATGFLRHAAAFDEADCIELTADVLKQMSEAGFLVEADRNELVEVEADYCLAQRDPSVLSLCIAPTYACNLACPYCYEEGRDSSSKAMSEAVQGKIVDFAKTAFAAAPYDRVEVQWYGGEPMLVPEAIERISAGLLAFCEEHGLGYTAIMVSNATRIGAEEAAMLKRSRVGEVLVTVDGPESEHNRRRPARDGSNSYEAVLNGIGNLIREYIDVMAVMNTDRVNDPYYDELNERLKEGFGIGIMRTKLNDYYGTYGSGRFCEPEFSLMDHREFARLQCDRFCKEKHKPYEFATLMRPVPLFCRGQMERYYCIDAMGDVYKCDGHMGRADHVMFDLDDIAEAADIPTGTAPGYPFDDAACIACNLLPICKGTCEWERTSCADHPCHPLKYTAKEYLRGWVNSLGPLPEGHFAVLSVA